MLDYDGIYVLPDLMPVVLACSVLRHRRCRLSSRKHIAAAPVASGEHPASFLVFVFELFLPVLLIQLPGTIVLSLRRANFSWFVWHANLYTFRFEAL